MQQSIITDRRTGLRNGLLKFLTSCCIVLSVVLMSHSEAYASGTYTAAGKVTLDYQGPTSPVDTYYSDDEEAAAIPIVPGQTVHATMEEEDITHGNGYSSNDEARKYYCMILDEIPTSEDFIKIVQNDYNLKIQIYNITSNGIRRQIYGYANYGTFPGGSLSQIPNTPDPIYGVLTDFYTIEVTGQLGSEYSFCIEQPVEDVTISVAASDGAETFTTTSGSDGTWSQNVNNAADYTSTAEKSGYTITTETPTVSSTSAGFGSLNFTAVPDSYPSILSASADRASISESELNATTAVGIDVSTNGAAEGTEVVAVLLTDQLAFKYYGYLTKIKAEGTVTENGTVHLSLNNLYLNNHILAPGYYTLMVMLEGTTQVVYLPFEITTSPNMPTMVSASVSPDNQGASYTSQATVSFTTQNVADGSIYYVTLTDSEGNPVSPLVTSQRYKISGNQGTALITVGGLPSGDYEFQITIENKIHYYYISMGGDITSSLVSFLDYTVYDETTSHDITEFTVEGQSGDAVIDKSNRTVDFYMPYGSDISALKPTVTINGKSVAPASGAVVNFAAAYNQSTNSYPITYTVKAQNGEREKWTVTCHILGEALSSKSFTDFTIAGQVMGSTVIDPANRTITVTMPGEYNENLSLAGLAASYTLSDSLAKVMVGSTLQTSGTTANDFRNPVEYTITAQDGTKAVWTVYVNCVSRHYMAGSTSLNQSESAQVTASVTYIPSGSDHTGKETVVFQLMKGNEPVNLVAVNTDITGSKKVSAKFKETGAGYTVRVYVFDRLAWESGCAQVNLAEPVVLQ